MNKNSMYFIFFIVLLIVGLNSSYAGRIKIVTTLPSLASITESVGGHCVKVQSITRGVQDAHYVEAKPSYMIKLHRADLLIYSGLELEIGWLPLLIQGARNDKVTVGSPGNLNASLALASDNILEKPRGEVDRSMGDVHPAGNPHYLLNPYNAMRVADLIAERLIKLDPRHKDQFEKNLNSFRKTLEERTTALENKADFLRGKEIVCYHVHWSYLLDWLRLKAAGYIELRPGIPPTPKHKQAIIQLMQEKQIPVVIVSSWKEPTKAREVAEAADAELVILPGEVDALDDTETYFTWIEYMVTHLIDAFPADEQRKEPLRRIRQRQRKRGTK